MDDQSVSLRMTDYYKYFTPKILGPPKFLGPKPGLTGLMRQCGYVHYTIKLVLFETKSVNNNFLGPSN